MMGVLRFFFVDGYNRFDVAVIITAAVLFTNDDVGIFGMLAILLGGFALSAFGETARERREDQP